MNERILPTRFDAVVFAAKAGLFRLRRHFVNRLRAPVARWPVAGTLADAPVRGRSRSALRTETDPAQHGLMLGKIQNLRVAARHLHGVEVPAGAVFSFWAQVGRPVARRGFAPGRELREGCIVPSVGGGLCQLSNALYQAALDAGLEIVERHAHSRVIPGSAAEQGRDATVFWNYVDLRFRADEAFRVEVELDSRHLQVRIRTAAPAPRAAERPAIALTRSEGATPQSCATCGEDRCFRRSGTSPAAPAGRTAYLLDGVWPEFDRWVSETHREGDRLLLPLDGRAWRKPQYAWTSAGSAGTKTFPLLALWRAVASRRLADQGAARQRAAIAFRRRLAAAYAESLHYLDEHVVVTQELLPYVWESGALQGRSFDVLMTALPMDETQRRLDEAFARHPQSTTLADFRAPDALIGLERQALRQARRLISPHHALSGLFDTLTLIPWARPAAAEGRRVFPAGGRIVFPASTLGRKGAYELREAARELGLRLTLAGPVLEAPDFWNGVEVERADGDALDGAAVVVLPSWVENRPARLLRALSAGVPVVATPACGLPPQDGLTLVAAGDVAALTEALRPYAGGAAPALRQSAPALTSEAAVRL